MNNAVTECAKAIPMVEIEPTKFPKAVEMFDAMTG